MPGGGRSVEGGAVDRLDLEVWRCNLRIIASSAKLDPNVPKLLISAL
jgi:hypothetical protein